jgi:hypothetical protein
VTDEPTYVSTSHLTDGAPDLVKVASLSQLAWDLIQSGVDAGVRGCEDEGISLVLRGLKYNIRKLEMLKELEESKVKSRRRRG